MAKSTNLDVIGDKIIAMLSRKNEARERGLPLSRDAIRNCANAIRAIHRAEFERAEQLLQAAHIRIEEMKQALAQHPDLRYGGFVYDAEKEYSEAHATMALVRGEPLPDPDELGVDYVAYVNGLGEAIGEMRRHLLDDLRRGDPARIEDLLSAVDDIYNLLISVDFPDAITSGLRRTTDIARGVLEKTRGDITLTFQQRSLERRLREIEANLSRVNVPVAPAPAEVEAPPVPKPPVRRRRVVRPAPAEAPAEVTAIPAVAEAIPIAPEPVAEAPLPPLEAEAVPLRRRRRRRKAPAAPVEILTTPVVTPAPTVVETPGPTAAVPSEVAAEAPPRRRRRRRRHHPVLAPVIEQPTAAVTASPIEETPVPTPTAPAEPGEAPPTHHRRRRRRRPAAVAPGVEDAPAPVTSSAAPEAPSPATAGAEPAAEVVHKRRRRRRRRPATAPQPGEAAPLGLSPPPDSDADGGPFPEPW